MRTEAQRDRRTDTIVASVLSSAAEMKIGMRGTRAANRRFCRVPASAGSPPGQQEIDPPADLVSTACTSQLPFAIVSPEMALTTFRSSGESP
jgi:hypothetical protein